MERKINWKTRLGIPLVMLGTLGLGALGVKINDYRAWKKNKAAAYVRYGGNTFDKIADEFDALSLYFHRNDKLQEVQESQPQYDKEIFINPDGTPMEKPKPESELEKEARLRVYRI